MKKKRKINRTLLAYRCVKRTDRSVFRKFGGYERSLKSKTLAEVCVKKRRGPEYLRGGRCGRISNILIEDFVLDDRLAGPLEGSP